ncbi:MAG: RluA family pseudouridine synthase [Spirochaetales bacterium]|nr:RluA family pseudouridine synthase [Spirochaetales bacterium]
MTRKREIKIQKNEAGIDLLTWISKRYTYHPLEKWKDYIENFRVLVNSNQVTPDFLLQNGDVVIYYPEPVIEPPINSDYQTIYEDDDLLVINKPADIPCHPGGIYFENTLWYILKEKYEYISLVNRLDRETSGTMLIAKNKESASFYFNKMMEREIEKEYIVLVHGVLDHSIDAKGWLTRDSKSTIRKKRLFTLDENATQEGGEGVPETEYSHSFFEPIKSQDNYTLINCKIYTGRTHQIRATLFSLGYPVVGDKIYGLDESFFFKFINDTLSNSEKEILVIQNQALHSYKTTLPMLNGGIRSFVSTPPQDWPLKL